MTTLFDTAELTELFSCLRSLKPARVVIITDEQVGHLHGPSLLNHLKKQSIQTDYLTVSPGETSKSRQTKAWLEDQLLAKGCGRDTALIALGGGMITDLVGFVAATYCRGIPLITLPTSLMAMVDAAIGGKNGINTPSGKNLLGTIRLPEAVIIQTHYLDTLPQRDYLSAWAEVIKYALIADSSLLARIESSTQAICQKDVSVISPIISRCIQIKERIIEEDLLDKGQRALLNAGHTIGHAIESASDYQINHGQAVGLGLLYEGMLAMQHGLLSQHSLDRIHAILSIFSLLTPPTLSVSLDRLVDAVRHDKKNKQGIPHCVLLRDIGQPHITDQVTHPIEQAALVTVFQQWLDTKKPTNS